VNPPTGGGRTDFEVRTPSATASVRGTEFDMDTNNLAVDNGTVAFRGNDGVQVPVSQGQNSTAGADLQGGVKPPAQAQAESLAPPAPVGSAQAAGAPPSGAATAPLTGNLAITIQFEE
jgi:hypothetical protein